MLDLPAEMKRTVIAPSADGTLHYGREIRSAASKIIPVIADECGRRRRGLKKGDRLAILILLPVVLRRVPLKIFASAAKYGMTPISVLAK
jgi:hypothetical protein